MVSMRWSGAATLFLCAMFFGVQAEFYPERMYKERKKASLNIGWKFFQGSPASGTPSDSNYTGDAFWNVVNIPHSASYDAPTPAGERNHFIGSCWYRKMFTLPQAKHNGKVFLEFEGAMQVAQVWLNGKFLGTHDNSGYTWFGFDISDKVSRTGQNVLAVKLNNNYSLTIPPGLGGPLNGKYPDYYLFSGLYRDVWLVMTDQCFIPLYGQQISTPNASASTAQVRVKTTVSSSSAGSVKAVFSVVNHQKSAIVLTDSLIQSFSANQTAVLDKVLGPISNPDLWSPESPALYTLYTQVYKDGLFVDDNVERFGVRWYTWTPEGGFALNGTPTLIKGSCLHQSFGWIENALPKSRFFTEVALVKAMGSNLIRGAHFPRDPSFYNACDELGMMSMVEIPTWGTTTSAYPDSFWIRQNKVVREMIEVGYNHPSIMVWGLFNEPMSDFTAANQIPLLNATAHLLDSTRMTFMAHNRKNVPFVLSADVVGLNYGLDLEGGLLGQKARTINTEFHEGWVYECPRGAANDNTDPGGYAVQRWQDKWMPIANYTGPNKLAGGCMWSFNDYWSPFMDHPMGVVDHYRIPKAVYYYFRKQWTGKDGDYATAGLTATKLVLTSDNDILVADSTDISVITASFRDAAGKCVHTGYPNGTAVTFSVTGPANYFGGLTVNSIAGKCALIVKSKNTPGDILVSATATGLTAQSITIKSLPVDTVDISLPVRGRSAIRARKDITVKLLKKSLQVTMPENGFIPDEVSLYSLKGQKVACPVVLTGTTLTMDIKNLARGSYFLSIGKKSDNHEFAKQVFITR